MRRLSEMPTPEQEVKDAERWLKKNDPGQGSQAKSGKVGRGMLTTYTNLTNIDAALSRLRDEQWKPLVARRPGQAPLLDEQENERRARLEHVMTFLRPETAELLLMRHVERMTLEAIAAELCCSHVNIIKRLRVAEQDFRKHYGLHYNDAGVT
jgi:DNA-directed RNA polymerase specialized sigma24 family protein